MESLPDGLVSLFKDLYGFQNPQLEKTLDRGRSATNFLIADGSQRYFLKAYNPKRTREKIAEIQKAEQFFYRKGVPAIAPLDNKGGDAVFEYDDKFFGVFPAISDRELGSLPSEKAIASVGATLARLHLASKGDASLALTKNMDRWTKANFLSRAQELLEIIRALPSLAPYDVLAQETLEFKIKLAEENTVLFESLGFNTDTVLHGDYHYHNMFFSAEDEVSHVFDFERVMRGDRATELAYGLFFNCFDMNVPDPGEVSETHYSRARAYLAAYNEIYPLAPEEIQKGIRWYYLSQMVHLPWPINVHYLNNDFRCDDLLAARLERVRYFSQNLEKLMDLAVAK